MDLKIFYIISKKYFFNNYFFSEFRYNLMENFLLYMRTKLVKTI